jgi:hypothetical protein
MNAIYDAYKKQQALLGQGATVPGLGTEGDPVSAPTATSATGVDKIAGPTSDGGGGQSIYVPGGAGTVVPEPVGPVSAPPPVAPYVPPAGAPDATREATPTLGPLVANPTTGEATHDPTVPMPGAPAAPAAPIATPDKVAGPQSDNPTTAGPATTINDAFKKALLDRLNKPVGVDPNDPTIKAQTDAFSLAQTRAKQRSREAMASRAGATGQISDLAGSGAFDEGLSNLEQQQGESEASYNAGLMGDELTKQRDELYRYAALAGNQLSGVESRALQEKLANLDAQIKREQMTQQGGQFSQDLDLRKLLGEGQLGLGQGDLDLRKLLGQGQINLGEGDLALRRSLGEGGLNLNLLQLLFGNKQFEQGEAGTNARYGAGLDADWIKTLLGGLG